MDATATDGRGGNPYAPALQSGSFVANNSGADVTIVRDTNFDLESGHFTAPFDSTATIEVFGYDDGVLTGSQVFTLSSGDCTFVEFDDAIFDRVDEIVFETGGAFFGMDDLLIYG